MFGMGWPEIVRHRSWSPCWCSGPTSCPIWPSRPVGSCARVRQMADNAKDDIGREIGQDFSGLNLRDLDPREIVRRNFLDDDATKTPPVKETRILRPGEKPPFDPEAT